MAKTSWSKELLVNRQDGTTMLKAWIDDGTGKIYLPMAFQSNDTSKLVGGLKEREIIRITGEVEKVKNAPKEGNFFKSIKLNSVFNLEASDGDIVYKGILKEELKKRCKLIKNPELQLLAYDCLKSVPNIHSLPFGADCFNYKGGLVDYIIRLIDVITAFSSITKPSYLAAEVNNYDLDLLLTAAMIHRLGKSCRYYVDENNRVCEKDYGILNDDLSSTLKIYFQTLYSLSKTPSKHPFTKKKMTVNLDIETEKQLTHLIESSKGESKWGALTTEKTKEAYLLHYAECIVLNQAVFDKYLQNEVNAELYEGGVIRGYQGKSYYLGNIKKAETETTEETTEGQLKENNDETKKDSD